MDSNGPDVKVRGNAKQIHDKYETLARDAASSGSRVKAENYRQHAEHYLRILNVQEAAKQAARAEAEAARAARGENNDSDGDGEERKPRRHQSRSRDDKNTRNADTQSDNASESDGLKVVTPKAMDDAADSHEKEASNAEDSSEKPVRRRKAPARKKTPKAEPASEAAE